MLLLISVVLNEKVNLKVKVPSATSVMPLKLRRSGRYTFDKLYTAHIRLLDNTVLDINLPLAAKGRDCLKKIAQFIGLYEVDYFGVQFLTKKDKLRWVDLDKCLRKQLDRHILHKGKEAFLLFKVQFFGTNCQLLRQEITKYLFYLQLKSLILNAKLKCTLDVAIKLAALSVQAELDDSAVQLDLKQFVLLPNYLMGGETEDDIHADIMSLLEDYRGLTQTMAETDYIKLCQQLTDFGWQQFVAEDKNSFSVEVSTGVVGIRIVYVTKEKPDVILSWLDIGNMAFNRRHFIVDCTKNDERISLDLGETEEAKYLWKTCIAQHQFFRMVHNSGVSTAFRVPSDSDAGLFIKVQQSPLFKRRVTLTKRKTKEKLKDDRLLLATASNKSPTSSASGSVHLMEDVSPSPHGIFNPLLENLVDDAEFLHRYEDICMLNREGRGSSSTSMGSTPASSDYNTSDSESEREFRIQPIAPAVNGDRPVSLIFTRLSRIAMDHRDQLLQHLDQLIAEKQLENEFEQIFMKKEQSETSMASKSMEKNRDKLVLPYDDNRIRLNPNNNFEGTSYINASPIKIGVGKNSYVSVIATQSPLGDTVKNFWQMMWDENVYVIVMLSKLKENGVSVCEMYWPEEDGNNNSVVVYGQLSIKLNFYNNLGYYSIRSLSVEHTRTRQVRKIFQLQYTDWPETGDVPSWNQYFIEFLDEIHSVRRVCRDINVSNNQLTAVHCEDGAGRSGVVILTEVLLATIENNETLDIPITLARLRSQRMHLVQSVHQYKFVYSLLVTYLNRNRLI